ncbi:hypothetical protein [Ensifer soli]|uniref:hypothetical protein n=1 Tax=Ciceribacter sp. sgz301302 TaxID=3342379 RepID=UPI0035B918E7
MSLDNQARDTGETIGLIVTESGLDNLQSETRNALLSVCRGVVLAFTSLRLMDLHASGSSEAEQRRYAQNVLAAFDLATSARVDPERGH